MKAYVGYLWPFLLKLTGNQPEMAIKPAFFTYFHHKCGLHTLCGAFGPPQMSVMYVCDGPIGHLATNPKGTTSLVEPLALNKWMCRLCGPTCAILAATGR